MKKFAIIVAALPVLAYPWMLSAAPAAEGQMKVFLWLYPVYVILATVCAWFCRNTRPAMMWILVCLTLLTHAAMWVLVLMPQ